MGMGSRSGLKRRVGCEECFAGWRVGDADILRRREKSSASASGSICGPETTSCGFGCLRPAAGGCGCGLSRSRSRSGRSRGRVALRRGQGHCGIKLQEKRTNSVFAARRFAMISCWSMFVGWRSLGAMSRSLPFLEGLGWSGCASKCIVDVGTRWKEKDRDCCASTQCCGPCRNSD
jgi:hypothetical protein